MRRRAGAAPRRGPARLPPLRPPRAGPDALRRVRLGLDRPPRHRHRAAGARAGRGRPSGVPPGRRHAARRPRVLAAFEQAERGDPRRHADGRQGPRLPRRRRSASCSTPTRRCASPTSAPRSARSRSSPSSPAARAAAPRAAACSCRRSPPDAPSLAHAARHDSDGFLAGELERREALRYPPFSTLIRDRLLVGASRARRAAAAAGGPRRLAVPALGPAPLFRLRGRERSQVVVKAAGPARGDRRGRRRRPDGDVGGARTRRRASASTSTRSRRVA